MSGGVRGDGSFDGGGFSGGVRVGSVFGTLYPSSSSLSTLLSYEALNNLVVNLNIGLQTGTIVMDEIGIKSVTVTKRTDWNAYVITGVYNGVTYVVVNGSGGRYYSPINDGYAISAIAGTSNYFLTNRPAGTAGNGYLGDLQVSRDNIITIQEQLSGLSNKVYYYTSLKVVNGQYRYYLFCSDVNTNANAYYVCNSAGQLYYAFKDDVGGGGGDGVGSSFDATEVIAAINSVYDAIEWGFWDVCSWLDVIQDNITSFNTDVLIMSQNMINGFTDLHNVGNVINTSITAVNSNLLFTGDKITSTINTFRFKFEDYFSSLGKSYPVLTSVKLSGYDNLFKWSDKDIITDIRIDNAEGYEDFTVFRGFHYNDAFGPPVETVGILNVNDGFSYTEIPDSPIEISCVAPNGYDRYVAYNWCTNGDFRSVKNNSGKTAFSADGAVFDGWNLRKLASADDVVISVKDGFVNYSVDDCVNYNRLYYPLSIDYEVGKIYTLSAIVRVNNLVGDGSVFLRMGNGNSPLSGVAGYSTSIPYNVDWRIVSTTMKVTTSNFTDARIEFLVDPGITCDIDILAVKLERQGVQSLAFEYFGSNLHLFSDVYSPPNPIIVIDAVQYPLFTSLSFLGNDHDRIFYDAEDEQWKVYRYRDGLSYSLPVSDQEIMNKTLSDTAKFVSIELSSLSVDTAPPLFYDGVNSVNIQGDAIVTISYYHTGTWFEYVYFMMDKIYDRLNGMDYGGYFDGVATKLDDVITAIILQNGYIDDVETTLTNIYNCLVDIEDAVIDADNVIIDITTDNDAFHIFYVEKSDGTTESVGDTATDAAKVIGEFLSVFYRLIFSDGLDNADIIHDFEDVYSTTNSGVNVW